MRTSVTCRIALLLSVLVLVAAGCTDEPTERPDLTVSESGPTESAPSTDEQAITDIYKSFYSALIGIHSVSPEVVRSTLEPFAEGKAVEVLVAAGQQMQAQNLLPSGAVTFGELDIAVNQDAAQVLECRDGTTEVAVDASTGATVSAGVPNFLLTTSLTRAGGKWKVVDFTGKPSGC